MWYPPLLFSIFLFPLRSFFMCACIPVGYILCCTCGYQGQFSGLSFLFPTVELQQPKWSHQTSCAGAFPHWALSADQRFSAHTRFSRWADWPATPRDPFVCLLSFDYRQALLHPAFKSGYWRSNPRPHVCLAISLSNWSMPPNFWHINVLYSLSAF